MRNLPSPILHLNVTEKRSTRNARKTLGAFSRSLGLIQSFGIWLIFGLSELAVAFISQAPLSGVKRSLIAFLRVCPRPRVFDLAPQEWVAGVLPARNAPFNPHCSRLPNPSQSSRYPAMRMAVHQSRQRQMKTLKWRTLLQLSSTRPFLSHILQRHIEFLQQQFQNPGTRNTHTVGFSFSNCLSVFLLIFVVSLKKMKKKKENRCARARGQVRGALKLCLYANLLFRPREEKKGPRCKGERAELRVAHILVAEMTAHLLVHCCKADERSPPKKIKN